MQRLKVLCTACALMAAAGAAQATVTGVMWGPNASYTNVPSTMPGGTPNVTFTASGIDFDSRNAGNGYTIGGWLATGGATGVSFSGGTLSGTSVNNTLMQITGSLYLAPGVNNFTIDHDDGVVLYVAGYNGASVGAYGTPVVCSPGVTAPVQSNFTLNNISGVGQLTTFVLDYNETMGAPAVLVWTYASGAPIGVPPPGSLSNARASQRSGTALVDLFYDLSGIGSAYSVSISVSSDGGASFTTPATHFTGNGMTSPTAPGTGRHIIWDAGADFPGQFSTKMRLKLALGSAFAVSPIFTLDTRAVPTGTLTGLVQGNGTPLANAQVRIDGTPFTTNTAANGRFTLTNVPVGSGYLLMISAAGFGSKSVPGITVTAGTTDLGTITLGTTTGPYQVIPLAPDVNPATTTVEQGGTAYRYYLVQNATGQPQGGVAVSVQVAGGSPIPQPQDISGYWPGQVAGTSDADGIVRIAIPSSALGAPGTVQTIQLSLSGQVQQTFRAQTLPRQYDQVWKQILGGGIGVGEVLTAEADTSAESDLRHQISNGAVVGENIARIRQEKLQAGVGINVGSSFTAKLSAGAGVSVGATLSSTYSFYPGTTDAGQNAMKLYVDLGNVLSGLPGPANAFYTYVEQTVEPSFLGSNLTDAEADAQAGLYADATLDVGVPLSPSKEIGIQGSASASADVILGYEQSFGGGSESASVKGIAATVSADLAAQWGWTPAGSKSQNKLAYSLFSVGLSAEQIQKDWTRQGQSAPYRSETIQEVSLQSGWQIPVLSWQQYDPGSLFGSCERDFTETIQTTNGCPLAGYFWSVYAGQQAALSPSLDLGVCSVSLQGELDQGAEAVNERGVIWQSRYWPAESYPPLTSSLFPSQSWGSILWQWGKNSSGLIGQALHQAVNAVASAGNTVIQAGEQGWNATLTFGQNVMPGASQVVSSCVADLTGSGPQVVTHQPQSPRPNGGQKDLGPLPSAGASNYVYGIGGIFRFASSNAFNGTGALAIAYSPTSVTGLNAADLRICQLPDGTNRWQLVGGTVDTPSNVVTASITNLGTYAIAPPLPTGDLWLQPSTNALVADGVSQITVVVTNLLLNTGASATQAWLFTASAVGVGIINSDADASRAGVQIVSTNATLTLQLQAPLGGTYASVSLRSVAGDAYGQVGINLVDNTPPATPANVTVTAGQSRIWVSWRTNSEPDLAGYRVYYRAGAAGPPWDGTAAVEGSPSPVQVSGTNVLLRGLAQGTNYFVAVSALDTTGNESPLSAPVSVTTTPGAPAGPTGVGARFGSDGTNILMWALSEDDGYNDRDVIRYDVFQAVLPEGLYVKVGEVPAGVGLYCGTNLAVSPTQYVGYAVAAVASDGLSSAEAPATRFMADGRTVDTDGDGIPDSWMLAYFGHPTGQASDQSFAWNDPAGDGLSNLQKYLLGRNPLIWDNLHFVGYQYLADGRLRLTVFGQAGHNYTLLASTNLVSWAPVFTFACTNGTMNVFDPDAKGHPARFYRLAPPVGIAGPRLGLGSARPLGSNGLDLALFSVPGLEYRVDASSDLVNWTAVTNFISTNAIMYFWDASATNYSKRFYRAVAP